MVFNGAKLSFKFILKALNCMQIQQLLAINHLYVEINVQMWQVDGLYWTYIANNDLRDVSGDTFILWIKTPVDGVTPRWKKNINGTVLTDISKNLVRNSWVKKETHYGLWIGNTIIPVQSVFKSFYICLIH